MTEHAADRRLMRILAAILTGLWAVTAIAIATAYRPGGPVDIVVALACFLPVLVADAGFVWPPVSSRHRHKVAIIWIWIAAVLLVIPVLYGVVSTLAAGGPQSLVPSFEAAYAGVLALFAMALFSVLGYVHKRHGTEILERRSTLMAVGLAGLLTLLIAAAFGLVAIVNDQALREDEPSASRYGPTDADLVPPFCDEPLKLGQDAAIEMVAKSSLDNESRGSASLSGQRGGRDESWGASWSGPDGEGRQAYLRLGALAWLNDNSDDPHAPGTTWREVQPDPFGLVGTRRLTTDGPPHAIANVPRGEIVAEDLGLEIVEGARVRHCRTFMDGPTALDTFLPLRWLLLNDSTAPSDETLVRWRGEMDWWVFGDGELGRAAVEISGSASETGWDADGTRAVLQAELEATDRNLDVDVSAPEISARARATARPSAAPQPAATPDITSAGTLESAAP